MLDINCPATLGEAWYLKHWQIFVLYAYGEENFKMSPLEIWGRLIEEIVMDVFSATFKHFEGLRTHNKSEEISKELGDILFWFLGFANHLFVDLEALLIIKYISRPGDKEHAFCTKCGFSSCICDLNSDNENKLAKNIVKKELLDLAEKRKNQVTHDLNIYLRDRILVLNKYTNYIRQKKSRETKIDEYLAKNISTLESYILSNNVFYTSDEAYLSKLGYDDPSSIKKLIEFINDNRRSFIEWINTFCTIYERTNKYRSLEYFYIHMLKDLGTLQRKMRILQSTNKSYWIYDQDRSILTLSEIGYYKEIINRLVSAFAWFLSIIKIQTEGKPIEMFRAICRDDGYRSRIERIIRERHLPKKR